MEEPVVQKTEKGSERLFRQIFGNSSRELTYNDLHKVTVSEQAHDGAVTGTPPAVQYAYDLSIQTGNIWTDNTRLEKVTYPDGRVIGYSFGHASTGARWTHAAFGG